MTFLRISIRWMILITLLIGFKHLFTQSDTLHFRGDGDVYIKLSGNIKLVIGHDQSKLELYGGAGLNFSDENTNQIVINGDIVSSPFETKINGTLVFTGNTKQNLRGNLSVNKLLINNAKGVDIAGKLLVSSELNFTNGKIFTSNPENLSLHHNTIITGNGSNRFVDGPVAIFTGSTPGEYSLFFPIGKGNLYKPVELQFSQSDGSTTEYKAELYLSTPKNLPIPITLKSISDDKFWELSNNNSQNVSQFKIMLPVGIDDSISNLNLVRIVKSENNAWRPIGGTGLNATQGTIESTIPFDNLGDFILGINNDTLPQINIINQHLISTIDSGANVLKESNDTWIEVNDPRIVALSEIHFRGISSEDWVVQNLLSSSSRYLFNLPGSFDMIGIEYYFKIFDVNNNIAETQPRFAYLNLLDGITINIPTGRKKSDYQVLSFPLEPTSFNSEINDVFNPLGKYKKKKWRLFKYEGDRKGLVEYLENGFGESIEAGEGYLLINNQTIDRITTSSGTTVNVTPSNPLKINIEKGWNLIGNPYLFQLFWEDVIEQNPNVPLHPDIFDYDDNWDLNPDGIIEKYSGTLIYSNEDALISIPVLKNPDAKRRRNKLVPLKNSLDESYWEIHFKLKNKNSNSLFHGIGMHPNASIGLDNFDIINPPYQGKNLSIEFIQPEFSSGTLGRNIVPTANSFIWSFNIFPSSKNDMINLSWQNDYLGDNKFDLILLDLATQKRVNMKMLKEYTFNSSVSSGFRIYFGDPDFIDENITPQQIDIGSPFPNPFSKEITIPVYLPISSNPYSLEASIYDLSGKLILSFEKIVETGGFKEYRWDGKDHLGKFLPNGFYVYKLIVLSPRNKQVLNVKVILNR